MSLRMASEVFPFASISRYLPKRMNVMSIADVSKNVIIMCISSTCSDVAANMPIINEKAL